MKNYVTCEKCGYDKAEAVINFFVNCERCNVPKEASAAIKPINNILLEDDWVPHTWNEVMMFAGSINPSWTTEITMCIFNSAPKGPTAPSGSMMTEITNVFQSTAYCLNKHAYLEDSFIHIRGNYLKTLRVVSEYLESLGIIVNKKGDITTIRNTNGLLEVLFSSWELTW